MKKIFFVLLAAIMCVVAVDAKKKDKKDKEQAAPVVLKTSSDSLSYAGGYANTNGLIPFLQQQYKVDTAYMADFIQGLKDARQKGNDPRFVAYNAGAQIQQMLEQRMIAGMKTALTDAPDSLILDIFYSGFFASLAKDSTLFKQEEAQKYFESKMQYNEEAKKEKLYGENRRKGEQFLAQNSTKDSVVTLPSGLQYKVLTMGTGEKPKATQEVTVKYEGKLIDGTVFDSSYSRKDQTTKFRANQVIKGWTEALQLMPVGSKWELYIPQELAYGDRQSGKIPPYSALIFTVELVDITSTAPKAAAKPAAEIPIAKAAPAAKKATTAKKTPAKK
ncbi:MAG: FKBP-type peptidyl-prolyl cis-trans isomerase [Prevotella sp.]|nr:FKBP-type peptidyl-prolyl cis-trans isomerase [Prevotella sp.]